MTDVLIDRMTYNVENQEIDWYGYHEDHEQLGEGELTAGPNMTAKAVWSRQQSGIKTYAEADAIAQRLLEVYRKVRITKTVTYVEIVLGDLSG